MIERSCFQVLKKRIQEPRRFIQFITDPRQVGKTTLVRQLTDQWAQIIFSFRQMDRKRLAPVGFLRTAPEQLF